LHRQVADAVTTLVNLLLNTLTPPLTIGHLFKVYQEQKLSEIIVIFYSW